MTPLILSIFPGIDLLGRAFEEAWPEACLVRGPDLLWGGDVRSFHPPAGVFGGVIGGPPCQAHSRFRFIVRATHGEDAIAEDLIPEFERCIREAAPHWFLMENVPDAPLPELAGYSVWSALLDNRDFGAVQQRARRWTFGIQGGEGVNLWRYLETEALHRAEWAPAVLAAGAPDGRERVVKHADGRTRTYRCNSRGSRRSVANALALQGLPPDFLTHCPLTVRGQQKVIGNGVPLPMGRAVARAVRAAVESMHYGRAVA